MRLFHRTVVAIVIPCLLLTGCGGGGASSPEAAFEGFKAAMKAENWEEGFTYLTPKSQDTMLSMILLPLGFMKAFAPAGEMADLDAILTKHGIDLEGKGDNPIANVKNKGACFHDIIKFMQAKNPGEGNPFNDDAKMNASLTDVKIDGTKATGKVGAETIHFEQIDGKWMIDMTAMMGMSEASPMPSDFEMPDPSELPTFDSDDFKAPTTPEEAVPEGSSDQN